MIIKCLGPKPGGTVDGYLKLRDDCTIHIPQNVIFKFNGKDLTAKVVEYVIDTGELTLDVPLEMEISLAAQTRTGEDLSSGLPVVDMVMVEPYIPTNRTKIFTYY